MRTISTDVVMWRGLCVCLCVPVTTVSPAKTAEPIEMPFGYRVGLRNHVLDGRPDPELQGTLLRDSGSVQSSRSADAANTTQQGAEIRADATITVATCYSYSCLAVSSLIWCAAN